MDHHQHLQAYIQQQLGAGMHPDEIANQLKSAGWTDDLIHQGFLAVQAAVVPSAFPAPALSQSPVESPAAQVPYEHPEKSGNDPYAPLPMANGKKRGRLKTSWLLLKQSFSILRGNKHLLRYLLMTGVWIFLITAIMTPVYMYGGPVIYSESESGSFFTTSLGWAIGFCHYLLIYFVINMYAAGLTSNVLDIFMGRRQTYKEYMGFVRKRIGAIFIYSVIGATVGIILEYIVERFKLVGLIVGWLLGALWSLGTLFVVPIIVTSDKNSAAAIKESIRFFKQTWGESVIAKTTVNFPIFLMQLGLAFLLWPMIFIIAFSTQNLSLIWGGFIVWVIAWLTLAVIGSFANSLINIALFYFAAYKQVPPAFSAELLNSVFVTRKPNRLLKKLRG